MERSRETDFQKYPSRIGAYVSGEFSQLISLAIKVYNNFVLVKESSITEAVEKQLALQNSATPQMGKKPQMGTHVHQEQPITPMSGNF